VQKYREEFNLMKLDYEASPLRLYRGESLVEPADVNEALTGAVVQVFFTIQHYYMREKKFDPFGADILQKNKSWVVHDSFWVQTNIATRAKDHLTLLEQLQVLQKVMNQDGTKKDQSKWKVKELRLQFLRMQKVMNQNRPRNKAAVIFGPVLHGPVQSKGKQKGTCTSFINNASRNSYGHGQFSLIYVHNHIALRRLDTK